MGQTCLGLPYMRAPHRARLASPTTPGCSRHLQGGVGRPGWPPERPTTTDHGHAWSTHRNEVRQAVRANALAAVGQTADELWKTQTEASKMTEMRFGIRGTKRPRNRHDEGDRIGIGEGDRKCTQRGPG